MTFTAIPASGAKLRASVLSALITEVRQVTARAQRTTSSSTTTTETGVLRADSVALKGGHHYRITTTSLFVASSVNNDVVTAKLRATTDGSTATTSSTQLHQATAIYNFAAGPNIAIEIDINPSSDVALSLLLSVARTAGTGNVSLAGGATFPIGFWIDDMTFDNGNIGTSL